MSPSSTREPAVSASAASSAMLAWLSAALPSVHTPTRTTRSSRSWRYSTSETSASSVESPATLRSAERSSRASSPALGTRSGVSGKPGSGESGYVIANTRWWHVPVECASELLPSPPGLRQLPAGHQHRRAAQEAGGVGDGDDDVTARDAHGEPAGVGAVG